MSTTCKFLPAGMVVASVCLQFVKIFIMQVKWLSKKGYHLCCLVCPQMLATANHNKSFTIIYDYHSQGK